jgi:hypothetical protein
VVTAAGNWSFVVVDEMGSTSTAKARVTMVWKKYPKVTINGDTFKCSYVCKLFNWWDWPINDGRRVMVPLGLMDSPNLFHFLPHLSALVDRGDAQQPQPLL